MKQEVVKVLKKAFKDLKIKIDQETILKYVEVPKDHEKGDFAFPCFFLTDHVKQLPHDMALDLREKIKRTSKRI